MKNLVAKAVSTGPGRCAHTIVIVLDNARAHLDIEIKDFSSVSEEKEIVFLKLGPYSFLLNPIELAWSQIKATIKREMKDKKDLLHEIPPGPTQKEHRLRVMEETTDFAMAPRHAPDRYQATGYIARVSRYYNDCLAERNLRE